MGIRDYLRLRSIRFDVLLHRPAPSAARMAESLHQPGRIVAKAVLIKVGDSFMLAVVPSTHRVDLDRLSAIPGVETARIATETEVMTIFHDCERGALPPLGRLYGLTTVVDAHLAGCSEIVFVGNSRHEGFRLKYRDFERVESPMRARFATLISPKRRVVSQRKAG